MISRQPNTEAWPFDANCTHQIFAATGTSNLLNISSTCQFFRRKAIDLAKRKLMNIYNIDCDAIPGCMPVPLLSRVESYYDVLHHPIDATKYYLSSIDPTSLVTPGLSVISICVQNNDELILVGTFAKKSEDAARSSDKANDILQFAAGVDANGHVYVKRITESELNKLISEYEGLSYLQSVSCHFESVFIPCWNYLLTVLKEQKKMSFKDLIANIPWDASTRNQMLPSIEGYFNKNKKQYCCQIL